MKISLVCKEKEMVSEAKKAFELTDELRVFSDWKEALAAAKGIDLMIVDLVATLTEPTRIDGYEEFAMHKMGNKDAAKVPLVIISPPDDCELDSMVGWPDFVFGHVKRPVTMKIFRRISTWV